MAGEMMHMGGDEERRTAQQLEVRGWAYNFHFTIRCTASAVSAFDLFR
jgi:hypothetical protein